MRKIWIWAVLVLALLMIAACRPEAGANDSTPSSTEDLGICKPEDEDCDDEGTETVEATRAPIEETQAVEEPIDLGDDPLAVRDTDWAKGPDDAFFTIMEYADFQ